MSSTKWMLLITVALVMVLAVGCSGGETTETPTDGATTGAEGSSQGLALVEKQCTMCHTLDRVNSAVYDEATWTSTVERMEANGLVVTPEDKQAIIDYLTERDSTR